MSTASSLNRSLRLLAGLALMLAAGAAKAAETEDFWGLCGDRVAAAEARLELPYLLLQAVALVESGRRHEASREITAWPWTVMAEGRGRYLPTKAAAIAEVKALRERGIRNIDVGCMQINLGYHPEAFASLEEAFDPDRNIAYAASFLLGLRAEARSWTRAVGLYHSRKAVASNDYRRKVLKQWREARHKANRKRREEHQKRAAAPAPQVARSIAKESIAKEPLAQEPLARKPAARDQAGVDLTLAPPKIFQGL